MADGGAAEAAMNQKPGNLLLQDSRQSEPPYFRNVPETLLEPREALCSRQELVLLLVQVKNDIDLLPQAFRSRAGPFRMNQDVPVGANADAGVDRGGRLKIQFWYKVDERGFDLARSQVFQPPDILRAGAEEVGQSGRGNARHGHQPVYDETEIGRASCR